MTIQKFRIIDMLILTIIAILSEYIGSLVIMKPMYISAAQVIIVLIMCRWGWKSLFSIILISASQLLIYPGSIIGDYLVNIVPWFGLLIGLIWLKLEPINKLRNSKGKMTLFFLTCYLSYMIIEGLIALCFAPQQYNFVVGMFSHIITIIIGIVVIILLSGQKKLLINMEVEFKKDVKDRELNEV